MSTSQYIIGIDLGTTNCTLAYLKTPEEGKETHESVEIHQFPIEQITTLGTQEEKPSLPSFLYFPTAEEGKQKGAVVDWAEERNYSVGLFARERGGELPRRLVASAKSWLCHGGVNRRDALLPQDADEEMEKMSPVAVSAAYLQHLRECWNRTHPEASFEEQQVLVTVPASFDPDARQLVQEAVEQAGYPEVVLLEEPQAALYSWLQRREQDWRDLLSVGDSVLVVDVGGGTTDFSLVSVSEEEGNLLLERVAVGSHLLLGGDNMDLALAYLARGKLEEEGHALSDAQFQSLIHASRKAKEELLSEDAPETYEITLLGRGRSLIKSSLKVTLQKEEVLTLLVDGFLPLVAATEQAQSSQRSGIQQIGLPYAQDPRVTSQLAKFLSMTGEQAGGGTETFICPSAVLFNGGTLKADALQERIVSQLNQWASELKKEPVQVLDGADLDFSVSRGAAYYGLARTGKAVRIRGGTSRSYFVGVEDAIPAIPGLPTPLRAICIAPFGMEEGTECELESREFSLLTGEQATFRFFSCSTPALSSGTVPEVGTEVRSWKQELTELHPIETTLSKEEGQEGVERVHLKSRVTELGMLELWCCGAEGKKWKLEFDVREEAGAVEELVAAKSS